MNLVWIALTCVLHGRSAENATPRWKPKLTELRPKEAGNSADVVPSVNQVIIVDEPQRGGERRQVTFRRVNSGDTITCHDCLRQFDDQSKSTVLFRSRADDILCNVWYTNSTGRLTIASAFILHPTFGVWRVERQASQYVIPATSTPPTPINGPHRRLAFVKMPGCYQQKMRTLNIGIVMDRAFEQKVGNGASDLAREMAQSASVIFEAQFNIRLNPYKVLSHDEWGCQRDDGSYTAMRFMMTEVNRWRQTTVASEGAAWIRLSACPSAKTSGVANIDSLGKTGNSAMVVQLHPYNFRDTWETIVHELGHSFGALHPDGWVRPGVMNYYTTSYQQEIQFNVEGHRENMCRVLNGVLDQTTRRSFELLPYNIVWGTSDSSPGTEPTGTVTTVKPPRPTAPTTPGTTTPPRPGTTTPPIPETKAPATPGSDGTDTEDTEEESSVSVYVVVIAIVIGCFILFLCGRKRDAGIFLCGTPQENGRKWFPLPTYMVQKYMIFLFYDDI
eukprot:GEMP01016283.1.p1 GENE.GEMP01016283.1~~GEMP01016283.1.p1  ORF type:complete len:502 (+),score=86.59 GEMP01016283.1:42-1547(+)